MSVRVRQIEIQKETERQAQSRRRGWWERGISIQRQSVVFQAAATAVKIGARKNNDGLKD